MQHEPCAASLLGLRGMLEAVGPGASRKTLPFCCVGLLRRPAGAEC